MLTKCLKCSKLQQSQFFGFQSCVETLIDSNSNVAVWNIEETSKFSWFQRQFSQKVLIFMINTNTTDFKSTQNIRSEFSQLLHEPQLFKVPIIVLVNENGLNDEEVEEIYSLRIGEGVLKTETKHKIKVMRTNQIVKENAAEVFQWIKRSK
ncbi:ARF/SAR type [Hexamita inflata]|uniref:ARF/SAR type n=1 Tax=Hexamita inflata TaxID=28002 RepID=A0AA86TYN1_9EUKA|nr:ARF/SAR type [Hexamita inflata]